MKTEITVFCMRKKKIIVLRPHLKSLPLLPAVLIADRKHAASVGDLNLS